jgi:hypothetical protein
MIVTIARTEVERLTVDTAPRPIERISVPEWIREPHTRFHLNDRRSYGEQHEWGWAIPLMYRAVADPANAVYPERPQPGDVIAALGYWTPLLHLLRYSLGWTRPDRGLCWWSGAGRPVDDDRLRLVANIWAADGQLDSFSSWLSGTRSTDPQEQKPLPAPRHEAHRGCAVSTVQPLLGDPVDGASLQLQGHLNSPAFMVPSQTPGRPQGDQSCATLVLDSLVGWHTALAQTFANSPKDVQVDVFVRPVGWLGTYRRSPATGGWYSGHHGVHVRGV